MAGLGGTQPSAITEPSSGYDQVKPSRGIDVIPLKPSLKQFLTDSSKLRQVSFQVDDVPSVPHNNRHEDSSSFENEQTVRLNDASNSATESNLNSDEEAKAAPE